jgi:hypothetical protein
LAPCTETEHQDSRSIVVENSFTSWWLGSREREIKRDLEEDIVPKEKATVTHLLQPDLISQHFQNPP